MTFYSVYTFYGRDEIARDLVNYCVNNPDKLDFDKKLHITYRRLEYGFGYVSVFVDYNAFTTIDEFVLVAGLIRGIE